MTKTFLADEMEEPKPGKSLEDRAKMRELERIGKAGGYVMAAAILKAI